MLNQNQAPIYEGLVKLRKKELYHLMYLVTNVAVGIQSWLNFWVRNV